MQAYKKYFSLIFSILIAMFLFLTFNNVTVKAEDLGTELIDQDVIEEDMETTEESSLETPEISIEDSLVNASDELSEEEFVIESEADSEETPDEIVEPSSEPDSSEEILIEELPAEPAEPLDQPIEQEYVETDLEQEVIDTDLELTKEEPNYEIRPIGNNLYFVNTETGEVRKDNAWIDYKGYHIFPNKEGILYRNQFITFGPAYKHYMDSEGKAARGLKQVGNNLYYFDESTDEPLKRGVMRKDNKWVKPNGSTESVFVNDKGLVYRNQWITFGPEKAYYMGNDGYKVKGEIKAFGANLHFTDPDTGNVRRDNAWIDYKDYHVFPNKEGILYRNQFITFGPEYKHYMDSEGKASKGLKQVGNDLYYFDESTTEPLKRGVMRKDNKWVKPNGSTESVFVNDKGLVYRNQWITFGSEEAYYMGNDGYKVKGRVIARGNNLHFTDPITGNVRKDNAWVTQSGSIESVFVNDKGLVYRNQWITFGPKEAYYMGNDGYKVKGQVVAHGNNLHFTDPITGNVRKDNSWIAYGEHRIFPNKEGILYRNQFITFGPDVAYYMNNSGYRAIGLFVDIKGNQYYADSTVGSSYGRIIRNNSSGYITIKGTKYYFSSDGSGKLRRGRIVYLDPGHGGRDSGAYYGGIREETLNLKISNLIKAGMEELGYEVIMSRTKDIYIDLLERARDANNKDPDIFVSVHNNAMPNDSRVNGIMTYYYKYYPEWQPVINPEMHNDPNRIEQSRQLADAIQKSLIAATGARDLGLRRNTFAVLRETKMPAVLLELGFMSNPTELSKLNTTSYQTTLANAVVKGIHNHFTQ